MRKPKLWPRLGKAVDPEGVKAEYGKAMKEDLKRNGRPGSSQRSQKSGPLRLSLASFALEYLIHPHIIDLLNYRFPVLTPSLSYHLVDLDKRPGPLKIRNSGQNYETRKVLTPSGFLTANRPSIAVSIRS